MPFIAEPAVFRGSLFRVASVAESLQVRQIPHERGVSAVRDDVVHVCCCLRPAVLQALFAERMFKKEARPKALPPVTVASSRRRTLRGRPARFALASPGRGALFGVSRVLRAKILAARDGAPTAWVFAKCEERHRSRPPVNKKARTLVSRASAFSGRNKTAPLEQFCARPRRDSDCETHYTGERRCFSMRLRMSFRPRSRKLSTSRYRIRRP